MVLVLSFIGKPAEFQAPAGLLCNKSMLALLPIMLNYAEGNMKPASLVSSFSASSSIS